LTIAYERLGDPGAPPVLLIMGLAAQLVSWPDGFCMELVGRGLHVIRFDNRDAGASTHVAGTPDFRAALAGDLSSAAYTLSDMAADTVGLLDALGLAKVHFVGASMGGFIAQMIAIEHPDRMRSLTSIMSSTGDPAVGQPHPVGMQVFSGGSPTSREDAIERARRNAELVGSPGYPKDLDAIGARAAVAYDRGFDVLGIVRQAVAVIATGDRTQRLRELRVPTLVIHGTADVMMDVSGGRATAAAIPGTELVLIEGMSHDLPAPVWPEIASRIAALVARADA
ncbi:MAG: alpha/beta fold hydrolase, partial [bacterium]